MSVNNPGSTPPTPSTPPQPEEQEVDVTDEIEKLLNYVAKKKEDDPHDTVLSRIHSRMKDIVEKLVGDTPPPTTPDHTTPPTTPTVTIPDLPQWEFKRKRGGRIVKRQVKKQEAPKT